MSALQKLFDTLKSRMAVKKVNDTLYFNGQILKLPQQSQTTTSRNNIDIK